MIWQPVWVILVPALALAAVVTVEAARRWRAGDGFERAELVSRSILAVLFVVVGLRPTATHEIEVPVPSPVDLVVLLDRTASMGALDASDGDRLAAAAEDLVELASAARGATISVVVFDDEARVAVPSTTDLGAVETFLTTVGWRPTVKASGSDISVALPVAEAVLDAAERDRPDNERFLVYAGDGEQTAETTPASFAPLAGRLDGALVLGYGAEDGGPMPVAPDDERRVAIRGVEQRSVPDHAALETIASDLGGEFVDRQERGALPEFVTATRVTRAELVPGQEYYWWFALVAVPFALHLCAGALFWARRAREEIR